MLVSFSYTPNGPVTADPQDFIGHPVNLSINGSPLQGRIVNFEWDDDGLLVLTASVDWVDSDLSL